MKHALHYRKICCTALLLVLMFVLGGPAFPQDIALKTRVMFIIKFVEFIKWPTPRVAQQVRKIGIYGTDDELFRELQDVARQPQKKYRLEIRQITSLENAGDMHLLYLPASKTIKEIKKVNESLGDASVLIFSEREGTARIDGAAVSLFEEEASNRMTFEYSERELKRRQLTADPELLNMGLRAK